MSESLKSIGNLSQDELYQLVYQMKCYIETKKEKNQPNEITNFLQQYPKFTHLIGLAQIQLGMFIPPNKKNEAILPSSTENQPEQASGVLDMMELDHEQQELLNEVQSLTPEMIRSLPAEQRQQVMDLREAMGLPTF